MGVGQGKVKQVGEKKERKQGMVRMWGLPRGGKDEILQEGRYGGNWAWPSRAGLVQL